ncbi:MAG TPA: glutathione S-transferase family protein [Hyphomicrobiaceae bacterium]|nr:glutathione S-transferase family protein [Hyphomicrobiaceae bacterium]
MKLYVTFTSPYARLARTLVIEKGLAERIDVVEAKTRTPGSPYYAINPSGRVPFLIDDAGMALEDSQVICAYLDNLDGKPRFHPLADPDWSHRRLEARARSMCDGIAVWSREVRRPEQERSPGNLAHELARASRMADYFETEVAHPLMQGAPNMAQFVLAVALDMAKTRGMADLTAGRPNLAAWHARVSLLPSLRATA